MLCPAAQTGEGRSTSRDLGEHLRPEAVPQQLTQRWARRGTFLFTVDNGDRATPVEQSGTGQGPPPGPQ
eukprot:1102440-Pyramimonas_sp.AAC.1